MRYVLALVCLALVVQATPAKAVSFFDDFENGMGNWTQLPDSAAALALNGPDEFKNRVPVDGLYSARQSALVAGGNGIASYHVFGAETGFLKAEVWLFEDIASTTDPIQGAMTIQTLNNSGTPNHDDYLRIGLLQFSGQNANYAFRTASSGFTVTNVARKSGWTKLGIEVDALSDGGQARFYIDDQMVGTSQRVLSSFSAITLGQNFNNNENFWYDGVSVVPEPSSLVIAALGCLGLVGFSIRRRVVR